MYDPGFDAFAKRLASRPSRRLFLRALPAAALGALWTVRGTSADWTGDWDSTAGPLVGGALATFKVCADHQCDRFRLWTTNPTTVAQLVALWEGRSQATIPNGALRRGPGLAAYNKPWSWHIDPVDVAMAETTTEVCDAEPSYVEEHLQEFLHVGRYCPWAAKLVALQDLR